MNQPAALRGARARLAIIASHPIQYQAPLFAELARRLPVHVFFAHKPTPGEQGAGFGAEFSWDVELLAGYPHTFLRNVSRRPSVTEFGGCDAPELYSQLQSGGFGAVLVMGWHLKCYLQAVMAAKRLGLPVMVRGDSQLSTPRSVVRKAAKAALYPILLRAFDAALFVGVRSREYYEAYGYPAERLTFSPHCVDNAWFLGRSTASAGEGLRRQLGVGRDCGLVLYAGKLTPGKRPLDVAAGVASLRERGVAAELLVAGSGELQEELVGQCVLRKVPLHLLGFQNQTRMPAVYAAADVVVLPGEETWGLVCNEAMACGKPIIVSGAVGCAPDLAADGVAGHVFALGDIAGLADALSRVLSCPPPPGTVRAKIAAYDLGAAADGIESARARFVGA